MSIFKRGRTYWYHFIFNGRHVQRSTKQGNPRTARQIEAAHRTALARGEVGIVEAKKIPGFRKAVAAFLAWSESEHREHPATYRRYVTSSVALLKFFGDTPIDRITAQEVERFKAERSADKKTVRSESGRKSTGERVRPATVNRELACLRALFNHAIKDDLPLRNPFSRVKLLPEQNEQTRVVTAEEQEKYLTAASPVLRDVALLMLATGMRPEEVYRIRKRDLHLAKGTLSNPHGKTKAAKRLVPLNSTALEVLKRRAADVEGEYLFPLAGDITKPLPKVNNAHDRALKASGVTPFRLYDFRHTWATRAVEAGVDLVTLAAMMGHSRIQMVMRYAHPTQQLQAEAMRKIEAHFQRMNG